MIVKVLLTIAVLLASLSISSALKCYACGGTATSDCAKAKNSSMSIQECPHVPGVFGIGTKLDYTDDLESENDVGSQYQTVCLKMFITDYQPKMLLRSCAVVPAGSDPCTFLQKHAHVQGCKSCKRDLCNGQRSTNYNSVLDMLY